MRVPKVRVTRVFRAIEEKEVAGRKRTEEVKVVKPATEVRARIGRPRRSDWKGKRKKQSGKVTSGTHNT